MAKHRRMRFHLQNMSHDQIDAVAQLWHLGWMDGHAAVVPAALKKLRTLESFQKRSADHLKNTRVAVQTGALLGFTMVQADEIYQMYVGAVARGTGVAQALMQDVEARIKAQGYQIAWLSCAVGNDRAARFYEKSGWINKRVETAALDTLEGPFHLDVWRFEKDLR